MLDYTNADAVMIGRGSLGQPWLFQIIDGLVEKSSIILEPSMSEKCEVILQHIQ